MSDSGFDTPRPKDQKLSLRAKISLGLLSMGLLTACGNPDPYTTQEVIEISSHNSIATATAEAVSGELMSQLSEEIKDSAVSIDFCSGTLVSLEEIAPGYSLGIIYSAGHCVDSIDESNINITTLSQPHKDIPDLSVINIKSSYILTPNYDSDFAAIAVLIQGNTSNLKPLGENNVEPGTNRVLYSGMSYGLGFPKPDGTKVIQPMVRKVIKQNLDGNIYTENTGSPGASGTGIFTENKLTHVHSGSSTYEDRTIMARNTSIPKNHSEMAQEARQKMLDYIEENKHIVISPEEGKKILDTEVLPSIMDTSCTTVDANGTLLDFRYVSVAISPDTQHRSDVHYNIDIQQCIREGHWEDVMITSATNPPFSYVTSHAETQGQACSINFLCGLLDEEHQLQNNFPSISSSKIVSLDSIPSHSHLFALSLDRKFEVLNDTFTSEKIQLGSPVVTFTKDGWAIVGVYFGSEYGIVTFSNDIQDIIPFAITQIDLTLDH